MYFMARSNGIYVAVNYLAFFKNQKLPGCCRSNLPGYESTVPGGPVYIPGTNGFSVVRKRQKTANPFYIYHRSR